MSRQKKNSILLLLIPLSGTQHNYHTFITILFSTNREIQVRSSFTSSDMISFRKLNKLTFSYQVEPSRFHLHWRTPTYSNILEQSLTYKQVKVKPKNSPFIFLSILFYISSDSQMVWQVPMFTKTLNIDISNFLF